MSYTVFELPNAKDDKQSIFRWLNERSPQGAVAWLDAYDELINGIKDNAPRFSKAPESKDCDFEIRQGLFKTRRGRVYRVLFLIEGADAYVLRVRGPGQAPVLPRELK